MSARRRRGDGGVDMLPSGRYRARVPASIDPARTPVGVFDTREEAVHELALAIAVIRRDKLVPGNGVTLRSYGERWLDEREKAGFHVGSLRSYWREHIAKARFVDVAMGTITVEEVREWLAALVRKAARGRTALKRPRVISIVTANAVRGLLLRVLGHAERHGFIKLNPVRLARMCDVASPRMLRADSPWTYLPLFEIEKLMAAPSSVIPECERLVMEFAIGTGLRVSEQWCLHLDDVHVDGSDPHVVVRYGSRMAGKYKPTKGGKPRVIQLFGLGRRAAKRWLRILPTHCPRNLHGLMFPLASGEHQRMSHGLPRFREYVTKLGLKGATGDRVVWHSLRHTAASMMISGEWGQTWTPSEIKAFLGHKNISTTERYAHLADTALKRRARATDETWRQGHDKVISLASARKTSGSARSPCSCPEGGDPAQINRDRGSHDLIVTLADRARCLLVAAVETRTIPHDDAVVLARDWLACVGCGPALRVLDGGQFAARAAVELCDAILAAASVAASDGRTARANLRKPSDKRGGAP